MQLQSEVHLQLDPQQRQANQVKTRGHCKLKVLALHKSIIAHWTARIKDQLNTRESADSKSSRTWVARCGK